MNGPKEVQKVYQKVMKDATKIANQQIRQEYEDYNPSIFEKVFSAFGLGWNPYRSNTSGKTGLGFTLSDVDAFKLENEQELVSRIAVEAVQQALIKNRATFLPVFLEDILTQTQEDSYFNPPAFDPRGKGSKYRNIYGRFSKNKWQ